MKVSVIIEKDNMDIMHFVLNLKDVIAREIL